MAELKKIKGRTIVDYMARDYDSLLGAMQAMIPEKLPEWTDFNSETDFGNVLLQLFAHMGDILSYYQDRVAGESFLGTAQTRRSIIHHLGLIGYKLATAAPASTELEMTAAVSADCDEIVIRKGDAFATKSQKDSPSVRFEYTREAPLVIDCRALPIIDGRKQVEAVIPVEEGRLVREEILGTSDGTADQRFTLARPRLILRSLGQGQTINRDVLLMTELETAVDDWTLQESLAFSREELRHFAIDIDEADRATVRFGDGAFGAIPPEGAIVKATYRVGGGAHGNVSAGAIQTIVDASQLALIGARVTNPKPTTGGADRESIAHAVEHAPWVFRSGKRAVTARDYETLASDFRGVGKVRAEAAGWNTVKLFVAPAGGGYVSDVLKANLLAYFEDKRPVTTLVEIEDVDYVSIFVTASIRVKSYYEPEEVRDEVEQSAGNLLAFENVDFGRPVYLSKFYEAIEAIEGVDYVTIEEFRSETADEDVTASRAKGERELGKIALRPDQVAVVPEASQYAHGIRIVLEGVD